MPSGANPLHYHKTFSETFTAIEGELGVKLGNKKAILLKPGETHTVEPLVLHSSFNPSNQRIKFNVQLKPGHTGFENTLRIVYGLAKDGLSKDKTIPKRLTHTAIILAMGDTNLTGFIKLMSPILNLMAKLGKENSKEQALIDKYCV